jgi:WD40 repeat protein
LTSEAITALAWKSRLMATAQGQTIDLWDPDQADNNPAFEFQSPARVALLAYTADVNPERLVSVDSAERLTNPRVRFWRMPTTALPPQQPMPGSVTAVAAAPAGAKLAAGGLKGPASGQQQFLQVWADDGTPLAEIDPPGRDQGVSLLALDPSGERLAWFDGKKTLSTIKVDNSDPQGPQSLTSQTSEAKALAVGLGAGLIALGYADGTIEVRQASSPFSVVLTLHHETSEIRNLAFGPDDANVLYSLSKDKGGRQWDLTAASRNPVPLKGLDDNEGLNLSVATNGTVAVGTTGGAVKVWRQGKVTEDPVSLPALAGQTGDVVAVTVSADGNLLAAATQKSGTNDLLIRAWDLGAPPSSPPVELQRVSGKATSDKAALTLSAPANRAGVIQYVARGNMDGRRAWLFAAGETFPAPAGVNSLAVSDKRVFLGTAAGALSFDLKGADQKTVGSPSGTVKVVGAAAGAEGPLLFTTSTSDNTLRVWKADGTGTPPAAQPLTLPGAPKAVAVDAAGKFCVVGFETGPARLYEVATGAGLRLPVSGGVSALAVLPDYRVVVAPPTVATSTGPQPSLWATLWSGDPGPDGKLFRRPLADNNILAAAWLKAGTSSGVVLAWDSGTGSELQFLDFTGGQGWQQSYGSRVRALAVFADPKLLVSGDIDRKIVLWSYTATALTKTDDSQKANDPVLALSAVRKGSDLLLASGSNKGQIGIWKINTTTNKVEPLATVSHPNLVKDVAFSPDGTRLASLGNDGSLKVWNVSTPSSPSEVANTTVVASTPAGSAPTLTFQLSWSPDGKYLVVGCSDKKAHVIEFTP